MRRRRRSCRWRRWWRSPSAPGRARGARRRAALLVAFPLLVVVPQALAAADVTARVVPVVGVAPGGGVAGGVPGGGRRRRRRGPSARAEAAAGGGCGGCSRSGALALAAAAARLSRADGGGAAVPAGARWRGRSVALLRRVARGLVRRAGGAGAGARHRRRGPVVDRAFARVRAGAAARPSAARSRPVVGDGGGSAPRAPRAAARRRSTSRCSWRWRRWSRSCCRGHADAEVLLRVAGAAADPRQPRVLLRVRALSRQARLRGGDPAAVRRACRSSTSARSWRGWRWSSATDARLGGDGRWRWRRCSRGAAAALRPARRSAPLVAESQRRGRRHRRRPAHLRRGGGAAGARRGVDAQARRSRI